MSSDKSTGVSRRYPVIPLIQEGASASQRSVQASSEVQQALGLPGELVENWQEKAVARLGELVKERRGLRVFLDSCTRCGACTDKCHYFLGTGDPKNMPVARQELLRSVYRRYFTWAGRYFPWLVGARSLDRPMLDDWYTYFYQCSECRRCTVYCPKGIDTSEITMAGREILSSIGLGQHYTQEVITKVQETGNNLGMQPKALSHVLESLEEDLLEETGHAVRLPVDDPDADYLLVTPSADFFAEPHIDGLMGYAKVMHAAGIRWTLSTRASEAANFALFNGNHTQLQQIALRLRDAANELGINALLIGECGHAWRVAYSIFPGLLNQSLSVQHICQLTHSLWLAGRIVLDPQRNAGKVVTFHDSCNVARGAGMGAPGDQFRLPRALLRASVPRFVDMPKPTIGQSTFCCGGGGGLLSDELIDLRVKGSLPRAQALETVVCSDAVTHIAAICAICKTQLSTILPHHDLAQIEVASLHQLVGDALLMTATPTDSTDGFGQRPV